MQCPALHLSRFWSDAGRGHSKASKQTPLPVIVAHKSGTIVVGDPESWLFFRMWHMDPAMPMCIKDGRGNLSQTILPIRPQPYDHFCLTWQRRSESLTRFLLTRRTLLMHALPPLRY
jgi:hypothetical protein